MSMIRVLLTIAVVVASLGAAQAQPKRTPPLPGYLERGGPDPKRVWTEDDVGKLLAMIEAGEVELPRISPAPTGELFQRLTDRENFEAIVGSHESLALRLRKAANFYGTHSRLLSLYLRRHGPRSDLQDEMSLYIRYFAGMLVRFFRQMETLESIPAVERGTFEMLRTQMERGVESTSRAILMTMSTGGTATYNRVRLAQAFNELLDYVAPKLPEKTLGEFHEQLTILEKYEVSEDLKKEVRLALVLCARRRGEKTR